MSFKIFEITTQIDDRSVYPTCTRLMQAENFEHAHKRVQDYLGYCFPFETLLGIKELALKDVKFQELWTPYGEGDPQVSYVPEFKSEEEMNQIAADEQLQAYLDLNKVFEASGQKPAPKKLTLNRGVVPTEDNLNKDCPLWDDKPF